MENEKYDIVTSSSASGLAKKVRDLAQIGWKPVGSHQVTTQSIEVQRAMTYHRYHLEYSQTLIRE